jgi:hypothetical protein
MKPKHAFNPTAFDRLEAREVPSAVAGHLLPSFLIAPTSPTPVLVRAFGAQTPTRPSFLIAPMSPTPVLVRAFHGATS